MKIKYLVFICIAFAGIINASMVEKQITKTGVIEIFSETQLFTIEATNKKVASILNTSTGDLVVSTLVRSFKFKEALVEEHFNENYMESAKYPKAIFKGKITNNKEIDYTKDGTTEIFIEGKLSIHGTTNFIKEKGSITIKDGKISAKTEFDVSLAAYGIKVEKAYKKAIKDAIHLKIHFNYLPYAKK